MIKPSNIDWKKAVIPAEATLRDAAKNLTESSLRIVLVNDVSGKLLGTNF